MNKVSKSKKFNVLIIGAGRISAFFDDMNSEKVLTHAHAFSLNNNFVLQGFYDIDYECAKRAAKRWKCKAYSNFKNAMDGIDVVCCCVPDEFHYEILVQVSDYPVKIVIAEKPLAQTLEQALKIKKIFPNNLVLNFSRRFVYEFQNLKKKLLSYGRFVKGIGYYGKGVNHNGSHMVDLLRFLFGEISEIEYSMHGISDFEADISCDVVLKIKDGFFSMIAIDSRIATVFEMDLFFEKARIRILNGGENIEIYMVEESKEYKGYYNYKIFEKQNVDYSNALIGLVTNVQNYLQFKEPILCTIDDGLEAIHICKIIEGSIR